MIYLQKIKNIDWLLFISVSLLAMVGFLMQYSVAGGDFYPWARQHSIRYVMAVFLMFVIAVIDIRFWYRWAWGLFATSIVLLLVVEVFGHIGMGAQRWIDLKVFKLQPSELTKIFIILVLARYYSSISLYQISSLKSVCTLLAILLVPAALVYRQPDLGTAILLVAGGISVAFLAGLSWKWLASGAVLLSALIPLVWTVVLRPYQQKRVLTFFNPESDPLGKGYHIMQSKIAIGSSGMTGWGFGKGHQTQLGFLPEKHTDFIFTVIAEEFECAVVLDSLLDIKFWVRNTVRKQYSFKLPLSTGQNYYPDFIAQLNNDKLMIVEYKGEPYRTNDDSQEKQRVGNLWASVTNNIHIMVSKDKDYSIQQQLESAINSSR